MSTDEKSDLPLDRLGSYLESSINGFKDLLSFARLPGGNSNPTYRLFARSGSYVLRRRPVGTLLPSAHAIDREFRVLTALQKSTVPAPTPLHFASDESILGSTFYVMTFVEGRTYNSPCLCGLGPTDRLQIYDEMVHMLANLHMLDYERIGLSGFGKPAGYFERQLSRWIAQYRTNQTSAITAVEDLVSWLTNHHIPKDLGRYHLVHGDFRLDNILFESASNRAIALLDWELATLGPPFVDISYQCMQWRLPASRPELRGLGGTDRPALGIPDEARYIDTFCTLTGVNQGVDWNYYLSFSFFRLASICQGIYRRSLDGVLPPELEQTFRGAAECVAETARSVMR